MTVPPADPYFLLHMIDIYVRESGLEPKDAFKVCMLYAMDISKANIDKAEFMRLAEQGWDMYEQTKKQIVEEDRGGHPDAN